MDNEIRQFIDNSTLLFIASRNAKGGMDVSPRGGQPSVLRQAEDGRLLLPDYSGNRRLDTIGNLLSNPAVALIILNRGVDRILRVAARAEISCHAEDLAMFPADDNPPISVMVLTPDRMEFLPSAAFARAGFWIDPAGRKPPLDLGGLVQGDNLARAEAGLAPVLRDAADEALLAEANLRDLYGTPSAGVQGKVCSIAGPGATAFLREATLTVFAHETDDGGIVLDLTGEAPLEPLPFDNRHAWRLRLPPGVATASEGEAAVVAVSPGRNEMLRLNGRFESEAATPSLRIQPREVYFHCPAAFARARIWQPERRVYWTGKRRFACIGRQRETAEVTSFLLAPADMAPIGPVLPGQYVPVSLPEDGLQRSYSVSQASNGTSLRITVRRTGNGGLSDRLHDGLHPGGTLLLGAPVGRFVLASPPDRAVALISAGVGITPLLPMLEHLAAEHEGRPVWFIHAARDRESEIFAAEARRIAKGADNIRLIFCHSRPQPDAPCDILGRLDAAAIARRLPVAETDFYLCGPETFMSSLREGLQALGAAPDSIRTEAFAATGQSTMDLGGKGLPTSAQVTFARTGKTATWTPDQGSLLDLALAQGVDVAWSCRSGDCQSCTQRVVSGLADYPSGDVPLLAEDHVLLCQCVPLGDLTLDC